MGLSKPCILFLLTDTEIGIGSRYSGKGTLSLPINTIPIPQVLLHIPYILPVSYLDVNCLVERWISWTDNMLVNY